MLPFAIFVLSYRLADVVGDRYRALVLLAAFGSLRWGELAALRRRHIDLEARTVYVEASQVELTDGSLITGPPKSEAGRRTVTLPAVIMSEVAAHIETYAQPGSDGLVFVGSKGAPLRRPGFARTWNKATSDTGLVGVHFHDLRHAGNTLAAMSGANLRELMVRMGHSTTRAAVIYQHRAAGHDRLIADAMGKLAEAELMARNGSTGTQRARKHPTQ